MSAGRTLALSTVTHLVEAPIEAVDLAEWLLNLSDAEYQRCSPAHLAAGDSVSPDGRRMKLNVETVGDALLVQHYVAEVLQRHHCRLRSLSDLITPAGRTTVEVLWELRVERCDAFSCDLVNHVHGIATDALLHALAEQGVPLEAARAQQQAALDAHNAVEVPEFAASVERRAKARMSATAGAARPAAGRT